MSYKLRELSFQDYKNVLESIEPYLLKSFYKKIKDSVLWFNHCNSESCATNKELIDELRSYLHFVDSDLLEELENRVEYINIYIEVMEHFEQDKSPLELEQDFELACGSLDGAGGCLISVSF